MYVQYGCGLTAPDGWLNFDASPRLLAERVPLLNSLIERRFPSTVRYGDITRGLPLQPGCCDGIYASHVLEHLDFDGCMTALRNTFLYLKPGGTFRLIVPDLQCMVEMYQADRSDLAAVYFVTHTEMGRQTRSKGLGMARELYGHSHHLWMWDERSLTAKLREHGFRDIRRTRFGDWEDARFADVEFEDRFGGCALGMQCRK